MRRYDDLRTLTFEINRTLGESLPHRFYALQFPEPWKRPLRELCRRDADTDQGYIPIRSLNAGIRALIPDIISTAKKAPEHGSRPWLYSSHSVETIAISAIVDSWVRTAFDKVDMARRQATLAGMPATDLSWATQDIDLNAWRVGDNGTAIVRGEVFTVLPDLLAAHLSRPGAECVLDETVLRFRRAPYTSDDKSGAEVMSWPPLIYPDHHNRPWAYSFVVSFTVQTVPFHSKPVIHCDIGLRRWVSDRVYLPGGEETSVYLLSAVPWLKGVHQSHAFQVAPMKWVPLKRSEGGDGQRGMLVWGNAVAPLLNDLNLQTPLPSPESLRDNPVAGLNVDGTPSAAVVYRNAMGRSHGVGAGVTPNDRRGILEWITSELSDYVRPTQPLHRVDIPVQRQRRAAHPVANVPVVNNSAAEDRRAHRLALVRATRGVLSVDILHQSFPMLQSLLETMRDDLGLPDQALVENGKQLLRWETPELTVIARAHPLGSVGAPLDIDTSGRRYANVGRATDVRADEVCRLLKGEGGTAALVELGGADEYARDADPKDAIRLGCARAGAVSQFITPYKRGVGEEAGTGHKAKHAWLDLVRRQLGVQIAPPRIALAGVEMPHPLHYVGVWLVKQFSTAHQGGLQHQIPVMVKLSSDSLDILATAPGLEGWLPYPQALRSLAQCDPFVVGRRDDGQVMDFIKDAMENDILPLGDVLLLTDAQNLRGAWKYLANNQLDLDRLTFGPAMPQSIRTWPGLRHVRIRTDEGSETPECFAINGEDYGFSAGLWAADPAGRVFASTGRKPGTFKQSARVSKIRSYTTSKSSSGKRPKLHAWNHQLVEITVAAIQPGDTPWVWAAETHELRSVAPHHNEMMTRPLPLHLARLMGEYVIPIANR